MSKLYHASLIPAAPAPRRWGGYRPSGAVLSVAVDGDEDEQNIARPTSMRVTEVIDGHIHTTEFYGGSLQECVDEAAAAHNLEALNLSDPSGIVTHKGIAVAKPVAAATPEPISAAATDDENDTDTGYEADSFTTAQRMAGWA